MLAALAAVATLAGAAEPCLNYGPHETVLQGRLEARRSAALRGTTQREGTPYLALVLDRPVCVAGYPRGLARREEGLTVLQLSGSPELMATARAGGLVEARGFLYHRRMPQQFTRVLLHATVLDQPDIFSK